jgi:hypothetical protein
VILLPFAPLHADSIQACLVAMPLQPTGWLIALHKRAEAAILALQKAACDFSFFL